MRREILPLPSSAERLFQSSILWQFSLIEVVYEEGVEVSVVTASYILRALLGYFIQVLC